MTTEKKQKGLGASTASPSSSLKSSTKKSTVANPTITGKIAAPQAGSSGPSKTSVGVSTTGYDSTKSRLSPGSGGPSGAPVLPPTAPAAASVQPTSQRTAPAAATPEQAPRNNTPVTYTVDPRIPAQVQATMAPAPQPTMAPPPAQGSAPQVTMEVWRADPSQGRGRDQVIFFNHTTGQVLVVHMQTTATGRNGDRHSIAAGPIAVRVSAPGTSMPQPETVMTIVDGQTRGGGRIGADGRARDADGRLSLPYRIHRCVEDARRPDVRNRPFSAGCFTSTDTNQFVVAKTLENWGVPRGAVIPGYVHDRPLRP